MSAPRPVSPAPAGDRAWVIGGGILLSVIVALVGALLLLVVQNGGPPSATSRAPGLILAQPVAAAPLDLVTQDGRPFSVTDLRGQRAFVFFGYTHCPDVCPATVGILGQVLGKAGSGYRAVFVSIDPERDTPAWLSEYVLYLPGDFVALTGSPGQVRTAADAWGVKYARIDTGSPNGYAMAHTADVFFVDADGQLRARFPFGTDAATMLATVRSISGGEPASTGPSTSQPASSPAPPTEAPAGPTGQPAPTPTPAAISAPPETLQPTVISSSVWAGGHAPVILALFAGAARLADASVQATAQLESTDGNTIGSAVPAVAVQPPGVDAVSYVATLDIPAAGTWRIAVTVLAGGRSLTGSTALTALDPGSSAPLGALAPDVHTPDLADVGGFARAITTDPAPDLRLSRQSTSDARAAGQTYVLVVDSVRFRVSSACGKAVGMARYLADRWPDVAFIHLEPFRYTVVTAEPVLSGDIADPGLTSVAAAWGVGDAPWGSLSMPWLFVVDGRGTVVAKYQGVMGSNDVDVILSLIAGDSPR